MSDFEINLNGLDGLLASLTELGGDATDKHIKRSMDENMADLLVASVALAPIDQGDLIRSGYDKVTVSPNVITGEVGFTAQAADGYPYPVRQHEDLALGQGPKTALKSEYDGMTPGTKYLERPFVKYAPKYIDNLADGVRAAIEEVSR